jgi:hypothetical protein
MIYSLKLFLITIIYACGNEEKGCNLPENKRKGVGPREVKKRGNSIDLRSFLLRETKVPPL